MLIKFDVLHNKVTPEAQHLHFQKYNMWWSNNARRMKKTMRCRLRWSEEQWTANVNHCCIFIWVRGHCENDPNVTQDMIDSMHSGFMSGSLDQTNSFVLF